jgi:hypothetical protein
VISISFFIFLSHDIFVLFFSKKHLLSGFLIREIFKLLGSKAQETRLVALQIVIDLLAKLDMDVRYQEPEQKSKIAVIFFPLVLIVCITTFIFLWTFMFLL